MPKPKAKPKGKGIKHWWNTNETVQGLKGKITIKRFLIFLSVTANIVMLIIIIAMI